MSEKLEICSHGYYGTLCHRCHPGHHTYVALADGKYKSFVVPGARAAIEKGKRMGAVAVYHRIYTYVSYVDAGGGGDVERELPDDDIQI